MGTVCSNYEPRWFYDQNTQKCVHFWYGGCDGNSNRFLTEAECIEACGGLGKSAAAIELELEIYLKGLGFGLVTMTAVVVWENPSKLPVTSNII